MVKNLISIFLFLFPLIAKCEWSFASVTGGGTLTDNTGWSLSLTLSDTSFSITKCNATGTETDIDLSGEISGFPIGYEITAIQNVFSGKAITSFTPPVSLTTIGANAFKNCSSLTNIVFPDNLAVINTSAFENCTALKQVILPDSPHTIGDYAFRNIGAELVSFGKKSVTIKNSAFINSPAVKRIYFRGDAPNMANGYAFQNSAKNNADSTLANKTRCYFIPFGNSTWDYVNAAQLLNDGDIENFELLFSDIPAKPAGLFNWFSLRSKNNDINLAANAQYLCYCNPDFGGVTVRGAPFELGQPSPNYGNSSFIDKEQSLTLTAPLSVNGTNCLGYTLAMIPEYGGPATVTTNLNATSLTLNYTEGISYLVTWLWDCASPYIHLTKSEPTGRNSMITSGGWSDYRIPHSDAKYLVALGIDAPLNTASAAGYTPSLSYATTVWPGGELNLGIANGPEGYINMMDSGHISNQKFGTINIYNGGFIKTINPGGSRSTLSASAFNVYTTSENPMKIYGAASVPTYIAFNKTFTSGEDAVVYIGDRPGVGNGITVVFTANDGYKGRFIADGKNTVIQLTGGNGSATMLGANPKSLRADHLVLKNGATLHNANGYSSVTTLANQGIYIDKSGAFIYKTGKKTTFNGPISGPGQLVFYSTPSLSTVFDKPITVNSLIISNAIFTCNKNVSSGSDTSIEVAAGATLEGYSTLYNTVGSLMLSTNGTIYIRDTAPALIKKAILKQGTVRLDLDTANGTCDFWELGEESKVLGPINITTTTPLPLNSGVKSYKFMTIPLSAGRITWRNFNTEKVKFDTSDGLDPDGILIPKVVVEYADDGLQHVFLKRGLKRNATTFMLK